MAQPTTNRAQRATFALMVLRYREQLGAAMRRRRVELGLSQKDVAEAAHVKEPQTVSRWERGMNMPSDLEAVAVALRWTIPEMMAGIQPPARVARKLDLTPGDDEQPAESQLDRIEAKLDGLTRLLTGEADATSERPVEAVAGVVARLKEATGSPPSPAHGAPRSEPARKRRRNA
jgi:transcriptional regulator with XRE-family HTH domain